jgi:hypothetical protein
LRRPWALVLLVMLLPVASLAAKREAPPPDLPSEHVHPSGAFTFRTPRDWQVVVSPKDPNAVETGGGGLLVRFIFRAGEDGFDSLHVDCMLERLAPEMEQEPRVRYEYDFLSGVVGNRRVLDSAFEVRYLKPIGGYTTWRQRNVTLVGAGQSLCAISYAPAPVWKKSKEARALLDAVLSSVTFR